MSEDEPDSEDSPTPMGSVLDDVFLEDGEDPGEGGNGLALDASQAQEIRGVFLASLPQYLDPVAEMAGQLFAASEPDEDTLRALATTLGSIAAAAERIGVGDVHAKVIELQALVEAIDGGDFPVGDEVRSGIEDVLGSIRRIADPDATAATLVSADGTSGTIVAAVARIPEIDKSVLEKLTAAGLVSVDQLRQARPDEIVAVSGLPPSVVRRLLDALVERPLDSPAQTESPGDEFDEPEIELGPRIPTPGPDVPLSERIQAVLGAHVDREAAHDRILAQVQRARGHVSRLRREVAAARGRRDVLRLARADLDDEVAERFEVLAELRAQREQLERALARDEGQLAGIRGRVASLQQGAAQVQERHREYAERVTRMRGGVARLLQATNDALVSALSGTLSDLPAHEDGT